MSSLKRISSKFARSSRSVIPSHTNSMKVQQGLFLITTPWVVFATLANDESDQKPWSCATAESECRQLPLPDEALDLRQLRARQTIAPVEVLQVPPAPVNGSVEVSNQHSSQDVKNQSFADSAEEVERKQERLAVFKKLLGAAGGSEAYWDGECTACPSDFYSSLHCKRGGRLVGERGCGLLNLMCEGKCLLPPKPAQPQPADWIIIGGGASGCAAAAALADAGADVIVIERGPSDLSIPETQQAQTWPEVVNTKAAEAIQWEDGTWGAVAKVLGGGTEVNGGLFLEEDAGYLREALGPETDLDELRESYRVLAKNLTTPLKPSRYGLDFAKALEEIGQGNANDIKPHLAWQNHSWIAYSTIDTNSAGRWPRRGAAILLHERSHLSNLRVFTDTLAQNVEFNGTRATGVHIEKEGYEFFIPANKGVILAAGAIFTPQILQHSGIGPSETLAELGIKPVVPELPVGKNFIDRNVMDVAVWSAEPLDLMIGYAMASNTSLQLTFETEAGGHVASAFAIASLALMPPDLRSQFIRDIFKTLFHPVLGIRSVMNQMMQLVALNQQTKSRGSVKAKSRDPHKAPSVSANFFSDPRDLEQQMVAHRELMKLVKSKSLQKYTTSKAFVPPSIPLISDVVSSAFSCLFSGSQDSAIVLPCMPAEDASQDRWNQYFRNTVVSSYHYFGTAAVGSVVESGDFRVKGTTNLHVADASVFPVPTHVNPQGTIMAVGHYLGKRIAAQSNTGNR